MNKKHIPQRTCVICRQRRPKFDLHRHVHNPSATPSLTPDACQVLPGRGYYVCGQAECLERFGRYRVKNRPQKRKPEGGING